MKLLILKPNRKQTVVIFLLCLLSFFLIDHFYVKQQKELTLELARVSGTYAKDLIKQKGDIEVKNDLLYFGNTLINDQNDLVDQILEKTQFGCTIFLDSIRISTTAKAKNSNKRSIGTSANAMIIQKVLKNGETFTGSTETIGKSWIIVYSPLRDKTNEIIGMLATFREESDFQAQMTSFRISLSVILLVLFAAIASLIEIAINSNKKIFRSKVNLANKNKEVEASEKKFKDLFENSYDLIQSTDIHGNFQYVNPAWCETLGYSAKEAKALTLKDIIHEDYINHCMNIIHLVKAKEKVEGTDVVFSKKDGDIVLLNGNIHCEFDEDNNPIAIKGIFRNDTDRKLSQKKLEESEKQYKFLVESANDIIYETDYHGNFIYVNEAVERITGYTANELIGTNYLSIVVDSQKEELNDFYVNHLKTRAKNSSYTFQIQSKQGKKIWIGQNVKTIFSNNDDDRIFGYLAVARDITDEKSQQLDTERQKAILERKNNAIMESIRYAKRIQSSILPYEYGIQILFEKSFILFEPKDIVSGDFYWYGHKGDYKFVAVVDCTGHGVPAAFMSIIGNNQLNEAIKQGYTDPKEILKFINKAIYNMQSNGTHDNSIKDGMDLSLCVINEKKREIQFCGAKNPLYLIRNNDILKYSGSRISVGTESELSNKNLESHSISILSNDTIYMFSDGYPDQFGGPEDKKYSYGRFRETLISIHHLGPISQRDKLYQALKKWKGQQEQTDDICVLGINFS